MQQLVLAFKSFMFDPISILLLGTLVAFFILATQYYEIHTMQDIFSCISNGLNKLKILFLNLHIAFVAIILLLALVMLRFYHFL